MYIPFDRSSMPVALLVLFDCVLQVDFASDRGGQCWDYANDDVYVWHEHDEECLKLQCRTRVIM